MKKEILVGLCFLASAVPVHALSDDDGFGLNKIVVTAARLDLKESEIGDSVTVITGKELREKGKTTVAEALRDVPGVTVNRQGGLGGFTQIYLRGGEPGQTMVMIDGVEVKYLMEMDGGFYDFGYLTTDNIERIEVIRGAQSPLYGSSAMNGVINIITKKGKGAPKFDLSFEGGSFDTLKKSIGFSGGGKKGNYSFAVSRINSGGLSAAEGGSEKDGSEITSASSRLGFKASGNTKLGLDVRYNDGKSDLDDGANQDDPNYTAHKKIFSSGADIDQTFTGWWEQKLRFSLVNSKRSYRDLADSVDTTEDTDSWYEGEIKKVDWQNNLFLSGLNTVIFGIDFQKEKGSSYYRSGTWISALGEKSVSNKGLYVQNRLNLGDRFFATLGMRMDKHELFGRAVTYKISAAYFIPASGTRFRTNIGTAFREPSLYQLYSSYGDIKLNPEKSRNYDAGVEQMLLHGKALLSATYFRNDFTNLIGFDMSTWKYKNIDKAQTKGVETGTTLIPCKNLTLKFSHTYLKAVDKNTGEPLTRRPKYKQNFNINYSFLKKGNINLNLVSVHKKYDKKGWPSTLVELNDYTKVDVAASYNFVKNLRVFGKVENIFDRKYQEVYGYTAPGISFSGGIAANF